MKAYRVWITFSDGLEGFASFAFAKRGRAMTNCAEQSAKYTATNKRGERIVTFDVREEEIPWTYHPRFGDPLFIDHVIVGDDEELTQVAAA